MSAHTPGPWRLEASQLMTGRTFDVFGGGVSVAHGGNAVSSVEVRRANALLISAAPDLLEALKAFGREYSITGWHEHRCYERKRDIDDECTPLCKQARAAIAKAEGK